MCFLGWHSCREVVEGAAPDWLTWHRLQKYPVLRCTGPRGQGYQAAGGNSQKVQVQSSPWGCRKPSPRCPSAALELAPFPPHTGYYLQLKQPVIQTRKCHHNKKVLIPVNTPIATLLCLLCPSMDISLQSPLLVPSLLKCWGSLGLGRWLSL